MGPLSPDAYAEHEPDRPAVIMGRTGQMLTYAELRDRSRQLAHLWRRNGIDIGAHVAVMLENQIHYLETVWASQRAGLHFTPVNWHLKVDEAAYVVSDCGAKSFIASKRVEAVASEIRGQGADLYALMLDGSAAGFEAYEAAIAEMPAEPLDHEEEGRWMFYSSGTTGRPKGIMGALSGAPFGEGIGFDQVLKARFGFDRDTVYLCPAPLYHAAPLGWSVGTQRLGGTVVIMESFDPAECLRLIDEYRVTHVQFVPTMFVRMLKLPDDVRSTFDGSSLRMVVHAAAPCPIEVKQQMIEWWGPVIHEYYAASEGAGYVDIGPEEWLAHRGSVGRPLDRTFLILDGDGRELGVNEVGVIWATNPQPFEYHNDPKKTAETFNDRGWATVGDMGYLDESGYLFLTDRQSNMIISGGANIYPAEIEGVLINHPAVLDCAVIGARDDDMGEVPIALVQRPPDGPPASDALAQALIAYCKERLATYKCPRRIRFVDELPRLPSGKLLKRLLPAADGQ